MKPLEHARARELRQQGHSINDICRELNVSKGAVSLWVRDVRLTDDQIEALNQRMIRNRQRFGYLSRLGGANTNRADAEKRHQAYEQAGFEKAKRDEPFRLICALYWGEGTKARSHGFSLANSDPKLLRVVLTWLIAAGFEERISFRVQYYAENGLTEEQIRSWWNAQLPALREEHWRKFGQCKLNRASQKKKIGKLPCGTATIRVNSTELFFNVMGGIKYLQEMGDW